MSEQASKKFCAVISAPPLSFPWGYDEEADGCGLLKLRMLQEMSHLATEGVTGFCIPLDSGVCLYAAEIVIGLQETNPSLELVCIVPYEEQATKWTPELRERYFNVLAKCTSSILISTNYTADCEYEAVLEAVDQSDALLSVQYAEHEIDPAFVVAVHYAVRRGKEIHAVGD
ncbi:MAG: DUF1273 family protein [Oscillospiraceae bacterium]|nr:DUF1273 family protein [Oscillospiraceae bacterium]